MSWHVYFLIDPRDGEIRYVGGSLYGKKRLLAHVWESNGASGGKGKNRWIQSLITQGKIPLAENFLSFDTKEEMAKAEVDWIRRLRAAGCILFNHNRPYHVNDPRLNGKWNRKKYLQRVGRKKWEIFA